MVNLYSIKKKRARIAKMLRIARNKGTHRKWIEALEDARTEINYKIKKMKEQKKVKKK